jgi:glycosyltransferase involved in cell wall biosynthesis
MSGKRTVILANGSSLLGNFICLLNYYLFSGTRIVLFWDSHLEPRTKIKKYFAKRCFLGCSLATMWSAHQVQNYARFFNLPEKQFIFIPYKANHSKMVQRELPNLTLEYIFSGGNGKRDYKTLVEAVSETDVTVIISTTRPEVMNSIENIPNVIPLAATEPSYAKLMAASRFVVIPMASTGLKGGGEANFCNAMWHGKPIIAMDDVSASDYIVDGETGFIVPPGDTILLRQRILELWQDKEKCHSMGVNGRKRVEQYFTHNLCINRLIRLAYLVGEDAL